MTFISDETKLVSLRIPVELFDRIEVARRMTKVLVGSSPGRSEMPRAAIETGIESIEARLDGLAEGRRQRDDIARKVRAERAGSV